MSQVGESKQIVAALGAGRMGRSIALAYALRGQSAAIIDFKNRSSCDFASLEQRIEKELDETLQSLVQMGMVPEEEMQKVRQRIRIVAADEAEAVLSTSFLVFEGVPETVEAKRDALSRLSALVGPEVVIASTTSTMTPDELATYVRYPERFLNAHWLNPAFLIPLVEVSVHKETSEQALAVVQRSLAEVGKMSVLCQGAGFIVPRLQALLMNEAARMVEEGVASAEAIDKATRYGLGFRFATIGVLEFIDFGGADILYYANQYLSEHIDAQRYHCPAIIEQKVKSGQLGLKTGVGFYHYEQAQIATARSDVLERNFTLLKHLGFAPNYL